MDCTQATNLISARLDREIGRDEITLLDAHLDECPTCRATAEALPQQDADLRHILPSGDPSALAERVIERLRTEKSAGGSLSPRSGRRLAWVAAAVVMLGGIPVLWHLLRQQPDRRPGHTRGPAHSADSRERGRRRAQESYPDRLIPGRRLSAPAVETLAVGATLRTGAHQLRRVKLPDGSILLVNQNSRLKVEGKRRLTLSAGEVFIEVAPRSTPFLVRTAGRELAALGTKFAVRAEAAGPGVVVTQGRVQVSGLGASLLAGQQLAPGAKAPSSALRTSHLLGWTRELMAAAESPLVPASKFGGGALVVVDADGQTASLSLRKYHVDVHIEDGFARTTIDQTYFNHDEARLEGTFYFPLPPDASLSRLAMYVDGTLMEGGMAERDYARNVFETIVARQKDPALLEWVDGNTFKMRVFPLEPRQEKRIILSYTQKLPTLYGRLEYRFPCEHSLQRVRDWSFHARIKGGVPLSWDSPSHTLQATRSGGDLLLDAAARNVRLDRDLQLSIADSQPRRGVVVRFSSAEQDGARYLMLRFRPQIDHPQVQGSHRRDWVFLFESSGERSPLLARAQIEIIRSVLANADTGDTFAILTASTRTHSLTEQLLPVTPDNVQTALDALGQTHLIGALDLGHALATAEPFLKAAKNPWLVHVGSGAAGIGERRGDVLARRLPAGVRYVGVGVGKRRARPFMNAAAERSDGFVTGIDPTEAISWRAFDLVATLNTARLLDVKVTDGTGKVAFLSYAHALAQGEELCAVTRLIPAGGAGGVRRRLPKTVVITGKIDGKERRWVVPVKDVAPRADYLPRTWARLEIDRLLAENSWKNKQRIVGLSKAMYVMTPFTSLLVLENEAMYRQLKVDRGRKDHWAMYPCAKKIPVVPHKGRSANLAGKPSAEQVLRTILIRQGPSLVRWDSREEQSTDRPSFTAWAICTGIASRPDREILPDSADDMPPVHFPPGERSVRLLRTQRGGGTIDLQEQVEDRLANANDLVENPFQRRGRRALEEKLAQPITLKTGIAANTPLQDALEYIADQSDLTILLDTAAFKEENKDGDAVEVETSPVKLPRLTNVSVATVLRLLLSQVPPNGGAYLIRHDYIEVTTTKRAFEKKARWFAPASDLVIPLPNSLPLQAFNQSLPNSIPAFHRRLNPAGFGGFGGQTGGIGGLAGGFLGMGGGFGGGGFGGGGFGGLGGGIGGLGGGGLGGQFGFQEQDPRGQLTHLIRMVAGSLEDWRVLNGLNPGLPVIPPGGGIPVEDAEDRDTNDDINNFRSLLYQRPAFRGDLRLFRDLVALAPGMNTIRADILAVLEAEAESTPGNLPGRIDPNARRLIDRARTAGWQAVTMPTTAAPSFTVTFDGAGRFAYKRLLATGLREQVVCDGKTLLHLYPDLGLGSRRPFSRFHLADVCTLLPWLVPAPEDLARGADMRALGGRTVAVVPRGGKGPYLHLLFARDGRLAERRLVEQGSGKVLDREIYDTRGTIRLLDARGHEVSVRRLTVHSGRDPMLHPDLRQLVVLPLPLRRETQVRQAYKIPRQTPVSKLDEEKALALLAALFAEGNADAAQDICRYRFHFRGDHRRGFYTLLAAVGIPIALVTIPTGEMLLVKAQMAGLIALPPAGPLQTLTALSPPPRHTFDNVLALYPNDPVARYLAAISDVSLIQPVRPGGKRSAWHRFLQRLMDFRTLVNRHSRPITGAEARAVSGGGVRNAVQDRLSTEDAARRIATESYRLFQNVPGLAYEVRYEYARSLLLSNRRREARRLFLDLYTQTLKRGLLPRIDSGFVEALQEDSKEPAPWIRFMKQTAAALVARKHRTAVVTLAWQCRELGDQRLAEVLLAIALDRPANDQERLQTTLAAIAYHWRTDHLKEADQLLASLVREQQFARQSMLWRLAAVLAARRRQPAHFRQCLERALEIDFGQMPKVIDLEQVRIDFGLLLNDTMQTADALARLKQKPPRDLVARVVRLADRWRTLDPDNPVTCPLAAQVLYKLGARNLAWDYLNTPLAIFPPEAASWLELAQALGKQEDFDLAALAYEQAAEAEPGKAAILWEWASTLDRAGKSREARQVYRRLATGRWEPRFRWMQEEAIRRVRRR